MSLARPAARINLAGRDLSAAEAALVALTVELCVTGAHDAARLVVWSDSKFKAIAAGDKISIKLGNLDAEQDVFSGTVMAVNPRPHTVEIEALSATAELSQRFVSQSYLEQTVADIVRDLAGALPIDQVDASLQVGAFHVDNRRPVWQHLQALAHLTGSDLGSSPAGALRFVPASAPGAPLRLRYGADLLDWDIAASSAPSAPAAFAHGAGSEAGSAKWHWLRHNPTAGEPARVPGALASKDAAEAVTRALSERAARVARHGRLLLAGNPGLRPGAAIELADLPAGNPGTLRVLVVHHSLDSSNGFLTRLRVESAGGGGAP